MRDCVDVPEAKGAETNLLPLAVRGLTLASGAAALLDGIDLRIADGGVTMIMGPNGAGKSLLLRVLHGLVAPTAGEVRWGGMQPGPGVRQRQAMVFQKPVLLRRSVAANIDFVLRNRGRTDSARRDAVLDHVGLLDRAAQPARLLSGGEQQRLSLARALALEPEVLLLDEPTASLDPASVAAIERIVKDASTGGTKILFVTHDVGQAKRMADDVVFLHRGRLAEHTGSDAFFSEPQSEAAAAYLEGRLLL